MKARGISNKSPGAPGLTPVAVRLFEALGSVSESGWKQGGNNLTSDREGSPPPLRPIRCLQMLLRR